jgi:transposase
MGLHQAGLGQARLDETVWMGHQKSPLTNEKQAISIKKNLWGIINVIVHQKNNAGAEGINSQIKVLKVKARGFLNKERFKSSVLFHFGGLDLYPKMALT